MNIHFRTMIRSCPECHASLKPYKTVKRTVRSIDMGEFTAVEHLKICKAHDDMKVFRSEHLREIVDAYCTYANDVMARSAHDRFISGRSSSEISNALGNGISSSHIRYLSNIALKIHGDVHRNNTHKIRQCIGNYILGIDGTPDPDFSMIICVMDHLSGFTLFSERCDSESDESIKSILMKIKDRFGVPSGCISDMRAGIVSALESVFPHTPGRICWFHFLRALGTDLMKDLHTDMGLMIRRIGIGASIKRYIRELPEAEMDILEFVEDGYSQDLSRIALFSVRSILEKVMPGTSSMGFPFGLRHLVFYHRIREAVVEIRKILEKTDKNEKADLIKNIISLLEKISCNPDLVEMADKLEGINNLFMELRKSMNVPDGGDLSVQFMEDNAHERSRIFVETLRVYTSVNIPSHIMAASKKIIGQYDKWEKKLFSNNAEHTIPTTNNGMERSFRKVRRNVRKRCGNRATSSYLKKNAEELLLYQNMDIPEYRNILYGNDEMIPVIFGRNRSKFTENHGNSRKRVDELIRIGMDKLISGQLTDNPYGAKSQLTNKNM